MSDQPVRLAFKRRSLRLPFVTMKADRQGVGASSTRLELENCDTVESVTAILREQTESFSGIRGKDKVLKPLKKVLSVLHKLSFTVNFGQDLGLVRP